jgi:hypothetical protein
MMHRRKSRAVRRWIAAAGIAACILGAVLLYGKITQDLAVQQQDAVRDAVLRCAVQCYSVEGAYPHDLDYMRDNYGLIVNEDRYIVIYDAFASNLLPQVSVLAK